jgi:hypothetical protein
MKSLQLSEIGKKRLVVLFFIYFFWLTAVSAPGLALKYILSQAELPSPSRDFVAVKNAIIHLGILKLFLFYVTFLVFVWLALAFLGRRFLHRWLKVN